MNTPIIFKILVSTWVGCGLVGATLAWMNSNRPATRVPFILMSPLLVVLGPVTLVLEMMELLG